MATWTVHAFRLTACGTTTVYVGVSYLDPAERLRQHLNGYKSSRQVRCACPELAEDLYDHLAPFDCRDFAEDAADELAAELVAGGYDVRADPNRLQRIARLPALSQPDLALVPSGAPTIDHKIGHAASLPSVDRVAA